MRHISAHTYDHDKAQQVYQGTLVFIGDARDLLARLEMSEPPRIDIRPTRASFRKIIERDKVVMQAAVRRTAVALTTS